jgi:hypothetical protein
VLRGASTAFRTICTILQFQSGRSIDLATYQFSALADGQAISFNPNTGVLNFAVI